MHAGGRGVPGRHVPAPLWVSAGLRGGRAPSLLGHREEEEVAGKLAPLINERGKELSGDD